MADFPAEIAQRILQQVHAPGAVLLRGSASILNGSPQNDIDVFIPKQGWDCSTAFGCHEVLSVRRFGTEQLKVTLKEAETGTVVDVDVFHQVTWRGLRVVDVENLPAHMVDALGLHCLDTDAEAWLTVVKNALHGSSTAQSKLEGVEGQPSFSVVEKSEGLQHRLNQQLTASAWAAARKAPIENHDMWLARFALIGIRGIENPFKTIASLTRWLVWRLIRR